VVIWYLLPAFWYVAPTKSGTPDFNKMSAEQNKKSASPSIEKNHKRLSQGCQMVYFQTKNPTLGKFWSVLQ
jgi:hypothetical protein